MTLWDNLRCEENISGCAEYCFHIRLDVLVMLRFEEVKRLLGEKCILWTFSKSEVDDGLRAMEAAAATLTGGDHVGRIEAYVSQVNTNYEAVAQKVRDALKSGEAFMEGELQKAKASGSRVRSQLLKMMEDGKSKMCS